MTLGIGVSFNAALAQVSPVQVPLTNGFVRSFAHVRLNLAGLDFTGGFKSFKRSRKRDREMPYSNNADPIGKTVGENKYEASAVMYFDWFANVIQTVESQYGSGYGDQPFTIYVSYVGVGLQTYTDTIIGCTIDSTEADDQQGTAALVREVNFSPTKIYFAGLDDNADPLVGSPL